MTAFIGVSHKHQKNKDKCGKKVVYFFEKIFYRIFGGLIVGYTQDVGIEILSMWKTLTFLLIEG